MAAGIGNRADGLAAQFIGQLCQLLGGQIFHVARRVDAVEQRCFRSI